MIAQIPPAYPEYDTKLDMMARLLFCSSEENGATPLLPLLLSVYSDTER